MTRKNYSCILDLIKAVSQHGRKLLHILIFRYAHFSFRSNSDGERNIQICLRITHTGSQYDIFSLTGLLFIKYHALQYKMTEMISTYESRETLLVKVLAKTRLPFSREILTMIRLSAKIPKIHF